MNSKYEKIIDFALSGEHYYTNEDIRINKKCGIMLNNLELSEYLRFKEEYVSDLKCELPLKSFNSKKIFYYESFELINSIIDYNHFFINDIQS